jgi:uncharacterized protein YciI
MTLPRADYLQTMSERERSLMKSHGEYLQDLCEQGIVICHGPVLDAEGPWGLSIFRADEHGSVKILTDRDPMIVAKTGARYRIVPMRGLRSSRNI